MRIFVVGSARHLAEPKKVEFDQACGELGQALASGEHVILICSESPNTADPYILAGVGAAHTRKQSEIIMYHPAETPPIHDPGRFQQIHFTKKPSEGGWDIAHFAAINDADLVMAIGGSEGTLTSIYGADLLKKPVVLVACYQGAARRAWGYFVHLYNEEERLVLNQEWTPSAVGWARQIVSIAETVAKRHRNRQFGSKEVLLSLIIGGATLIGWFTIFAKDSLFAELGTAALVLMAALASICGTVLRGILNSLGALRVRWQRQNLLLEGLGGMLVTFGLFMLSEVASFVLHGVPIPTDTSIAVRRVGFALSAISFFSSLFLEDAWNRLKENQVILPKS